MPVKLENTTLYSVLELSKKFDVGPATLRNYLKQGLIHGRKMGGKWFISENSIRVFFDGGRGGHERQ